MKQPQISFSPSTGTGELLRITKVPPPRLSPSTGPEYIVTCARGACTWSQGYVQPMISYLLTKLQPHQSPSLTVSTNMMLPDFELAKEASSATNQLFIYLQYMEGIVDVTLVREHDET